jgi:putative membrane protein
MVFMVLFWAALIVFGVWAVRRFTDRSSGSARHILEERFARGEIDADEFQRQRDLLGR